MSIYQGYREDITKKLTIVTPSAHRRSQQCHDNEVWLSKAYRDGAGGGGGGSRPCCTQDSSKGRGGGLKDLYGHVKAIMIAGVVGVLNVLGLHKHKEVVGGVDSHLQKKKDDLS